MKTNEQKARQKAAAVPVRSAEAGKPLLSEKEASAKKHEKAAMNLLKEFGLRN